MTLQMLVAAVNADCAELAAKMHIAADAIVVNQCDRYEHTEFEYNGSRIECFNMAERGVGLSRNTSLLRATGDIVLFADEDIVYDEGYVQKILAAFEQNPDADVIAFNVRVDERRRTYYNTQKKRIRFYNYGRYPAYAVAARRECLHKRGITFSLLFGGGAKYSAGEDSLFLHDCLKKGLHLYADTAEIGEEVYRESTWFKGFTDKFFIDRGVLYHYLYGPFALLWTARFLLAKRGTFGSDVSLSKAYKLMKQGIAIAKNRREL